jgi:hypothetical protein
MEDSRRGVRSRRGQKEGRPSLAIFGVASHIGVKSHIIVFVSITVIAVLIFFAKQSVPAILAIASDKFFTVFGAKVGKSILH